ncbi:MAG: hypothetical protein SGILL_006652 [Bacillariaceae sp.]
MVGTEDGVTTKPPQTLSQALKLPLYDPCEENYKKIKKSTDSTVSSTSSAGSCSRPPLPPKKRIKNNVKAASFSGATLATTYAKPSQKGKTVMTVKKPVTAKQQFVVKSSSYTSPPVHSQHTVKIQTSPPQRAAPMTQSPVSVASPRSITTMFEGTSTVGRQQRRPAGRRSLSKTLLGVDQGAETAPVQPMRRPSTEPEQHNLVLLRRHSSIMSASSNNSILSDADASQQSSTSTNSGDNITIATYPSICESHASEATIKVKNGYGGHEKTTEINISNTVLADVAALPQVTAKRRSFLPTPLEQVSERSISEHDDSSDDDNSSHDTFAVPSPKVAMGRHQSAEDIVFQPPMAETDALPMDFEAILDGFESDTPSGHKKKGRFRKMLKKFY